MEARHHKRSSRPASRLPSLFISAYTIRSHNSPDEREKQKQMPAISTSSSSSLAAAATALASATPPPTKTVDIALVLKIVIPLGVLAILGVVGLIVWLCRTPDYDENAPTNLRSECMQPCEEESAGAVADPLAVRCGLQRSGRRRTRRRRMMRRRGRRLTCFLPTPTWKAAPTPGARRRSPRRRSPRR